MKNLRFNPNINPHLLRNDFIVDWMKLTSQFWKNINVDNIKKLPTKVKDDLNVYITSILNDANYFMINNIKIITSLNELQNYSKVKGLFITSFCHTYKFYSDTVMIYEILKNNKILSNIDPIYNPFIYWKFSNEKRKHYDMLKKPNGDHKFFDDETLAKINRKDIPENFKNYFLLGNKEWRKDICDRWKIDDKFVATVLNNTKFFSMLEDDLYNFFFTDSRYFITYYTRLCCIYDFFDNFLTILSSNY